MPFGVYQGMWLGTELQRGMRDCCNGVSVLYAECGVYISHNSAHPTAYLKLIICKYISVKLRFFKCLHRDTSGLVVRIY